MMENKLKKTALLFFIAALAASAAAVELEFIAPSLDSPDYQVRFPFEVKKDGWVIKEIGVIDGNIGYLRVFQAGKIVELGKPLSKGRSDIVLNYAWKSGAHYRIAVLYDPGQGLSLKKEEFKGTAPRSGGIPSSCKDGFYRVYRLHEEAGWERKEEITYLTLTAAKSDIEQGNFCVFDGPEEISYQVIDSRESVPPESQVKLSPVTLTFKLALPLSIGAFEKKLLKVFLGEKKATAEPALELAGEKLGKTVRGSRIALEFHPKSGQINIIEFVKEGIKLFNKAGVIHWNPDVFIPGIAWDHSFDWNPPQAFEEKNGEFVYLNARKGPMPRVKDVSLEVRYTVEKDSPCFLSETRITVEKDLGVIAVRNDEMVLYKGLFDSLMYKDKNGEVVRLPLKEKEGAPFGLAHIAPADIPWVGLTNSKEGYGFFSLRLGAASGNLDVAGGFEHKAGTYFYAPPDGEYVYWVRPLIYTWADFATNNLLTFVPKGSFFYEKNAYLLLKLSEETPGDLDRRLLKLKNPIAVY